MKTFTSTLLLCAGIAVAGAAQAQAQIQSPPTAPQYKRDLYGDWRVAYPAPAAKSASQVSAELARAKADGQYTFGDEAYPPAASASAPESRAQVEQELRQAQAQGQMASDQEDYPPPAMAHSGASVIR